MKDEELEKIMKRKLKELIRKSLIAKERKKNLIFKATDENFEEEVVKRSKEIPVIVDFWARWCAPCLMLAPILEKIIKELNGKVVLAKVNVDENPKITSRYGITSIPFVIMFKNGREVDAFVGAMPEGFIREWIKKNLE